jgi:hypothetical protein
MSSKILKVALIQQKEIQAEEAGEKNPNFNALEEELPEREEEQYAEDEIDDFSGFSETQSQFNDYPVSISFCFHKFFFLFRLFCLFFSVILLNICSPSFDFFWSFSLFVKEVKLGGLTGGD